MKLPSHIPIPHGTALYVLLGTIGVALLFGGIKRRAASSSGKGGCLLIAIVLGVLLAAAGGTGTVGAIAGSLGGKAGSTSLHGTLNCSQLERLWVQAGGSPLDAFTAAEIARAESSGDQYSTDHDSDGSVDYGYWQINSVNGGSPASYDPMTNARQAVSLHAADGWQPWVTYQHGAQAGQC